MLLLSDLWTDRNIGRTEFFGTGKSSEERRSIMLNYKIFTTNGFIPKSKPIRYIDGEISSNLKKPMAVESLEINLTHNPELAKINSWKDFLNCTVDEKQSAFGNLYNMMFGLAVFEKNNPAYSQTTVIAIGYDSMDKFVLMAVMKCRYGSNRIYCKYYNPDNPKDLSVIRQYI